MNQRILSHFQEAMQTLQRFIEDAEQMNHIDRAAQAMLQAIKADGKILSCGNGGSHCDAMHFAEELTGRYRGNRPGIAAIAISDVSHISCVGNDYGYDQIFSRYVEAVGRKGDVLLAISTSGNSRNVLAAIEAAHERDLIVVALTGKGGGKIAQVLRETDVHVCVPHERTARIQEVHLLVLHCLCDGVDSQLLGEQENPS